MNDQPHSEACFIYQHAEMLVGADRTELCTCGAQPPTRNPVLRGLLDAWLMRATPCISPGGREDFTPENHRVIEFDGPRRAYFEVSDGSKYTAIFTHHERDSERVMRFVYRTIGVIGEDEGKVRDWLDAALLTLRTWCEENDAMIVWRARPSIVHEADGPTEFEFSNDAPQEGQPLKELPPMRWKARARFVTTKPMSSEMWTALCVKAEGAEFTRI